MIPFAAYIAAEIANAFKRAGQPQTLPLSVEGYRGFLGHTRVIHAPNGISIGSAVYARLTRVSNEQTDRQTDRQTTLHTTYVAIGRIYAMHVMLRKILFDSLVILLLISALRRRITH